VLFLGVSLVLCCSGGWPGVIVACCMPVQAAKVQWALPAEQAAARKSVVCLSATACRQTEQVCWLCAAAAAANIHDDLAQLCQYQQRQQGSSLKLLLAVLALRSCCCLCNPCCLLHLEAALTGCPAAHDAAQQQLPVPLSCVLI
jgi:hypothetical protein